jgi:hypothetical protein
VGFRQYLNLLAIAGKGVSLGVVKITPILQGFIEPGPGTVEPDLNEVRNRFLKNSAI